MPRRVGVERPRGFPLEGCERRARSREGLGRCPRDVAEEVRRASLLVVVLYFLLLFWFNRLKEESGEEEGGKRRERIEDVKRKK